MPGVAKSVETGGGLHEPKDACDCAVKGDKGVVGNAHRNTSASDQVSQQASATEGDTLHLLAGLRMDDSFFQAPPAPVIQGGYDFDTWQFWTRREGLQNPPSKEQLADPTSFEWAGSHDELKKTLFAEGVVEIGRVSEHWLQLLEDYCSTVPFNDVLSLGCERREDGYSACGEVLAAPWSSWMAGMKHSYGYASVITAFPTDGDNQGWHRDTPDNKESADHQITLMIYLTDVRVSNGATQFRRIASKDEVSFPGPRGSVVAFESSRTEHRGLANRELAPRVLMYIAYDEDD